MDQRFSFVPRARCLPFLLGAVLLGLPALCAGACKACIAKGPAKAAEQPQWLQQKLAEKTEALRNVGYSGGVFDKISWTQTSYMQTQMHPFDRYFYDPVTDTYTVEKFLNDLKERYGGVDAILLWPTYPNIGIDNRNQYDYWRAMPGGLPRLAEVVREVKSHGVRVLMPYNPWDQFTRQEGIPDTDALAQLIKEIGADGMNGDTMPFMNESFWQSAADVSWPLALEPELAGNVTSLNWQTMAWGYWNPYPKVPQLDRLKFFSSGKFMTNVCNRWAKRKVDDVQSAFFNGDGYETWENIWGIWNGIVPRDAEAIRRVATIERFFGELGFLQSPQWVPYSPEVVHDADIFASKWPLGNATLWTIVNRGATDFLGAQLRLPLLAAGSYFYDCYHGEELHPIVNESGQTAELAFEMEREGYGCVLALNEPADVAVQSFLSTMRSLTQVPLKDLSAEWVYPKMDIVDIPATAPATETPPGMVLIPKSDGLYRFATLGAEIEGTDASGTDFRFPWEQKPQKEHDHNMTIDAFFMDKFPVTVANYSKYLNETGYRPKDPYNWLKNWNGSLQSPPESLLQLPVTFVGLEEARAYCRWANGGSRLPHVWEWQYAAQGGIYGRKYPWGRTKPTGRMPKLQQTVRDYVSPEPVTRYAESGASPFGVADLVGNVWQYTDEFRDDHTRSAVLVGGSNYRPRGSKWYLPQPKAVFYHQRYLLFNERYERAGSLGFRCVKDATAASLQKEEDLQTAATVLQV
mmetsp:Transcript_38058/g.89062  ORF Transcript_38058/g.89062 Transcript_38058/m.89062 type:complete len:747 (-) Transcript_38058:149-2389(-)